VVAQRRTTGGRPTCRQPLWLCLIWCNSVHGGGDLGECVKYNEILFIYLVIYLYLFFENATMPLLQLRPVDGFSRLTAQTTRTRARVCLLAVSSILLPILGVRSSNLPISGTKIGVFKQTGKILKVSYYRNYSIDLNHILHNDGDHEVVIVGVPNRA